MDVTYRPEARIIDEGSWQCQYVRTVHVSGDAEEQLLNAQGDHRHASEEEALACAKEQIRRMQTAESYG